MHGPTLGPRVSARRLPPIRPARPGRSGTTLGRGSGGRRAALRIGEGSAPSGGQEAFLAAFFAGAFFAAAGLRGLVVAAAFVSVGFEPGAVVFVAGFVTRRVATGFTLPNARTPSWRRALTNFSP